MQAHLQIAQNHPADKVYNRACMDNLGKEIIKMSQT